MLKIYLFIIALLLSAFASARNLKIESFTDSKVSENGEPITLHIRIYTESRDNIQIPQLPLMTDWNQVGQYSHPSYKTTIINGEITFSQDNEYIYQLQPLRKGQVKIPPAKVNVGNKNFQTNPIIITVKNISEDPIAKKFNRNNPSPFHTSPYEDLDEENNGAPNTGNKADVFVRSEPSKTDVYVGELIVVPFYLYFNNMPLRNAEISKFPSFKGFLKEELFLPKTMTSQPVQLGGTTYMRTELIRYALFPLKVGKSILDSLVFKAMSVLSTGSLLNQMLNGNPFDVLENLDQSYLITKSAKDIPITVKGLPTAPANAIFTGGVGQFELKVKAPTQTIRTNQPFSVSFEINGRGNVKSIEEIPLKLPEGMETFDTKTSMDFRQDATGYKNFELLLLARKAGQYTIDAVHWSYFDPDKKEYVVIDIPPIHVNVEGEGLTPDANENSASTPSSNGNLFSPIHVEKQDFIKAEDFNKGFKKSIWLYALLAGYLLVALAFLFKKKKSQEEDDLAKAPWKASERKILSKKTRPAPRLAHLLDQWTREKIVNHMNLPLNWVEESRENILAEIRNRVSPEYFKDIDKLKNYWFELDQYRFTGSPQQKTELNCEKELKRAKEIVKNIENKIK